MQKLAFIKNKAWWVQSLTHLKVMAPELIWPTVLMIAGNVILLYAQAYSQSLLDAANIADTDLAKLTTVCLIALALCFAGLIVIFWSMSVWLVCLTAYAKTVLHRIHQPSQESMSAEIGLSEPVLKRSDLQANIKSIVGQKGFYSKFWFWLSLFCIPLLLPLIAISSLRVILGSPLLRSEIPGLQQLILPPIVVFGIDFTILFLLSLMTGLMFWSVAYSEHRFGRSSHIAYRAFTSFFGNSDTLMALSLVATLLLVCIGQPQIVFSYIMGNLSLDFGFAINLFWQAWFALICMIMWPILLRAYCEICFCDNLKVSRETKN